MNKYEKLGSRERTSLCLPLKAHIPEGPVLIPCVLHCNENHKRLMKTLLETSNGYTIKAKTHISSMMD